MSIKVIDRSDDTLLDLSRGGKPGLKLEHQISLGNVAYSKYVGQDPVITNGSYSYIDDSSFEGPIDYSRLKTIPIGDYDWPCGSTIVFGPEATGKSPFIQEFIELARKGGTPSTLIRFGEPLPGYLTDPADLAEALGTALFVDNVKVIAIDSIKDILSTMNGQLMARGVPRGLFTVLSQWATVAASLGAVIIAPVNISTDNAEAIDEVQSASKSNTTAAVLAEGGTNSLRFTGLLRSGEAQQRKKVVMNLEFGEKGRSLSFVSETGKSSKKTNDSVQAREFKIALNEAVIRQSIAKSLTRTS